MSNYTTFSFSSRLDGLEYKFSVKFLGRSIYSEIPYFTIFYHIPKIWAPTIVMGYIIFTHSLAEICPNIIIIGFDNTKKLLKHILLEDIWFRSISFQTLVMLDQFSLILSVIIYVPDILVIRLLKTCLTVNKETARDLQTIESDASKPS